MGHGHTFMLDKEPGPSSGYFASSNSITSTQHQFIVLNQCRFATFFYILLLFLKGYTHEDPKLHYPASCSFRESFSHQADYSYSTK